MAGSIRAEEENSGRFFLEGRVNNGSAFLIPWDSIKTQESDKLSADLHQAKGCGGVVIDGGVRDVESIITLGFPVFARYKTPADIRGRWRYVETSIPIRIGDVDIRPGDWAIGDANGVVIVPQDLTVEVLLEAEEVLATEDKIREELRAGEHPLTVYSKYGQF